MRYKISTIILMCILILTQKILADQPRYRDEFTSENKRFTIRLIPGDFDHEEWILIDNQTNKFKRKIVQNLSSNTVLICNHGMHFVVIDDFSDSYWGNDPTVLSFYFEDSLLNTYKLSDLVSDFQHMCISASHFFWYPDDLKLEIDENHHLKITTFELTTYSFDIITGEIIDKSTAQILLQSDKYVFGKVRGIRKGEYEMEVVTAIKGNVKYGDKLKFSSNLELMDNFYYSIMMKDGKLLKIYDYYINNGRP